MFLVKYVTITTVTTAIVTTVNITTVATVTITTGSGFPPSRKLGCNVATGSSLFSLGYAWVSTVPAGADVNEVHVLGGGNSHQVVCTVDHSQ